jgi:hypothetical protein
MTTPLVTTPALAQAAAESTAATITLFGFTFNMMAIVLAVIFFGILIMLWRIQRDEKLDMADLITKDGRSMSLTKVLQLIGGITGTWVIIKLTLTGGLTEAIFGLYLTYVGAIEGYSKFVAAKYNYNEGSVKDAVKAEDTTQ